MPLTFDKCQPIYGSLMPSTFLFDQPWFSEIYSHMTWNLWAVFAVFLKYHMNLHISRNTKQMQNEEKGKNRPNSLEESGGIRFCFCWAWRVKFNINLIFPGRKENVCFWKMCCILYRVGRRAWALVISDGLSLPWQRVRIKGKYTTTASNFR